MNDLIVVEKQVIGANVVNTINARELWAFMGVKSEFCHWIKDRIVKYNFVENQDFVTTVKKDGRYTLNEYTISIDMAKELSMVERNEKGKEARLYFIQCERATQYLTPMVQVTTIEQLKEDIAILKLISNVTGATTKETHYIKKGLYIKYGLSVDMLPEYTEPKTKIDKTAGYGLATDLLKEMRADIGIKTFNKRMLKKGYLDIKIIVNTKNNIVNQKTLTVKGFTYGFMKAGSPYYNKSKFKRLYSQLI